MQGHWLSEVTKKLLPEKQRVLTNWWLHVFIFGTSGKQLCLSAQRGQIGSVRLIDSLPAGTHDWRDLSIWHLLPNPL